MLRSSSADSRSAVAVRLPAAGVGFTSVRVLAMDALLLEGLLHRGRVQRCVSVCTCDGASRMDYITAWLSLHEQTILQGVRHLLFRDLPYELVNTRRVSR